jgi:hypothetical protein
MAAGFQQVVTVKAGEWIRVICSRDVGVQIATSLRSAFTVFAPINAALTRCLSTVASLRGQPVSWRVLAFGALNTAYVLKHLRYSHAADAGPA